MKSLFINFFWIGWPCIVYRTDQNISKQKTHQCKPVLTKYKRNWNCKLHTAPAVCLVISSSRPLFSTVLWGQILSKLIIQMSLLFPPPRPGLRFFPTDGFRESEQFVAKTGAAQRKQSWVQWPGRKAGLWVCLHGAVTQMALVQVWYSWLYFKILVPSSGSLPVLWGSVHNPEYM